MKKVVISSPVRQSEWCIERYLNSIIALEYPKEDLSLYWLTGDTTDRTLEYLTRFKEEHEKEYRDITVEEMNFGTPYSPHRWGHYSGNYDIDLYPPEQRPVRQRILNMIELKNRCLRQVLNGNDFVLILDADILLQPLTLKHLVETAEKRHAGIIAEIQWFKWFKWMPPVPNVWEESEYGLSQRFLDEITKPNNTVICGGMCPPYLVSRKAVEAGCNFDVIYNVPWWGEDRFLCVRAVALGFNLYADTHYPVTHLDSNEFTVVDAHWALLPERDSEEYRGIIKEVEKHGRVYPHWSRDWEYPWALLNSHLSKDMKVLDAGSVGDLGDTPFKDYLAKRVSEVHCVDKKPMAKSPKTSNIYFKQAGIGSLPYPDDYFDRVYCLSVLEHIVEEKGRFKGTIIPMKYIDEMLRVLKRSGLLILTFDVNRWPTQWHLWHPELCKLCQNLGVEPPPQPWDIIRSEAHPEGKLVGEGLSVMGVVLRKGG